MHRFKTDKYAVLHLSQKDGYYEQQTTSQRISYYRCLLLRQQISIPCRIKSYIKQKILSLLIYNKHTTNIILSSSIREVSVAISKIIESFCFLLIFIYSSMEHDLDQQNQEDIYVFDQAEEPEVTPSFCKAVEKWDKFKINVMENKNQQFNPKVLKENLFKTNIANQNRKNNQKKHNDQFLMDQNSQLEKQNQDFFVAENSEELELPSINQNNPKPQQTQIDTPISTTNDLEGLHSTCLTEHSLKKKKQPKKSITKIISGLTFSYNSEIPEPIIYDKKALLTSEIPEGIKLKCKLKRRKDLLSFLSPEFDFYLQSGFKHLLSAQKQLLSQSKVFKLSMDVGEYQQNSILCNLQCNALHNHYLLLGHQDEKLPYRLVHGEVSFQKLKKSKQPRDMNVVLPFKSSVGVKLQHLKVFTFKDVKSQYKHSLHSKEYLSQDIYPIQSEKNFELIDSEDDFCYLRLKKDSDNIFSIQIQHPLTPIQAFAIVLTRFDAQIK